MFSMNGSSVPGDQVYGLHIFISSAPGVPPQVNVFHVQNQQQQPNGSHFGVPSQAANLPSSTFCGRWPQQQTNLRPFERQTQQETVPQVSAPRVFRFGNPQNPCATNTATSGHGFTFESPSSAFVSPPLFSFGNYQAPPNRPTSQSSFGTASFPAPYGSLMSASGFYQFSPQPSPPTPTGQTVNPTLFQICNNPEGALQLPRTSLLPAPAGFGTASSTRMPVQTPVTFGCSPSIHRTGTVCGFGARSANGSSRSTSAFPAGSNVFNSPNTLPTNPGVTATGIGYAEFGSPMSSSKTPKIDPLKRREQTQSTPSTQLQFTPAESGDGNIPFTGPQLTPRGGFGIFGAPPAQHELGNFGHSSSVPSQVGSTTPIFGFPQGGTSFSFTNTVAPEKGGNTFGPVSGPPEKVGSGLPFISFSSTGPVGRLTPNFGAQPQPETSTTTTGTIEKGWQSQGPSTQSTDQVLSQPSSFDPACDRDYRLGRSDF